MTQSLHQASSIQKPSTQIEWEVLLTLYALLSRVPNSPSNSREPTATPTPASDQDSDFELPWSSTATPSIACESLKDLFTRALCDTLQKDQKWRNSIDVSEVKASPQVQRERIKNKGKQCSLSDKDANKLSSTCHICNSQTTWFKQSTGSGTLLRSLQAVTFDMLCKQLMKISLLASFPGGSWLKRAPLLLLAHVLAGHFLATSIPWQLLTGFSTSHPSYNAAGGGDGQSPIPCLVYLCLFVSYEISFSTGKMKFCTAPEVHSDSSSDLRDEVNIYMG